MNNTKKNNNKGFLRNIQSILEGAAAYFVGQIGSKIIAFIGMVAMTRTLSPDSFGVFSFVVSLVGVISVLCKVGTDKALLKLIPKYTNNPQQQSRIATVAVVWAVFGCLLAIPLMLVFEQAINVRTVNDPRFSSVFRIFIIGMILQVFVGLCIALLRSLQRPRLQILVQNFLRPGLRAGGILLALLLGYSIIGISVGIIVGLLAVLLLGIYLTNRSRSLKFTTAIRREDFIEFSRFSIPLTLQDTGTILYKHVDILMVGWLLTSGDVAAYKVAFAATAYFTLPLNGMIQIFTPISSQLFEDGKLEELEKLYAVVARWSFTLTLLPAAAAIIYRDPLLSIFGTSYTTAGMLVVLFIVSAVVVNVTGPSGNMLVMMNHQYYQLANSWVFGLLNIGLNYVLMLQFGVIGAAAATVTTNILANITRAIQVWYLERMMPISTLLRKPLIAVFPPALIMYVLSLQHYGIIGMIGGTIIGGILYLGILYALGIETQDQEVFRELVH
jgi:O-antigen/teichoic acid export membrane protein